MSNRRKPRHNGNRVPSPVSRRFIRDVTALTRVLDEQPRRALPLHERDQLEAASRERVHLTMDMAAKFAEIDDLATAFYSPTQDMPTQILAHCLVSLGRNPRECVHARATKFQPLYAPMQIKSVLCGPCLGAAQPEILRAAAESLDVCDWCNRDGVSLFREIVIGAGNITFLGNACDYCADALDLTDYVPKVNVR